MTGKKTILIVDDDDVLNDGLRVLLEKRGYAVLQANDGRMGKQIISNLKPDVVILDMMMPRLGGYPLLEHFRGRSGVPPFIMITANEGGRHKAYAEHLGVIDYIRKPFGLDRLLDGLNKAFNLQGTASTSEFGVRNSE